MTGERARHAIAVIRDVLLIVVLACVLVFGAAAVKAAHDVATPTAPERTTQLLPPDRCGGGSC